MEQVRARKLAEEILRNINTDSLVVEYGSHLFEPAECEDAYSDSVEAVSAELAKILGL